jgi:hypothetical protein
MSALGPARAEAASPLGAELKDGVLWVTAGERPVLGYRRSVVEGPAGTGQLFARSGYIHPLHAPNGAIVTDDFPADHLHQRGIFFAWTKTQVGDLHPDFWNLGSGTGRIRSVSASSMGRGPVRLKAHHRWEMRQGEEWKWVMQESWEVVVHPPAFDDSRAPGAGYVLDLTSRQQPLVDIMLPEYRYGGMAVRGSRQWHSKTSGVTVVTSEGKDRVASDGAKARWIDMSGPVDGKEAGVALLEHPSNPRAPGPVRMHPDVPYCVFTPIKDTGMVLDAGRGDHAFRYRLVSHNGPADPKRLEALWQEFSKS